MSGGIYSIRDDGQLVAMSEQPYASEDLLQGLLAKHPDLLAGDQMDSVSPRRWLLISKEVALASEQDGAGRWSVDHLFLDQDAIPTIVEVKRSSDTRIRREVVGQMFDYAANAVAYWPVETLRARFQEDRDDSEQVLHDHLDSLDADPEEFWQQAKTNLQAGKIRLVFVADEIPAELRRVVEFLNEQMDPAEVLAVEVKQYVGEGMKSLIPRVIGQTTGAQQKRSGVSRTSKQWDEASFFEDLEARHSTDAEVIRSIYDWTRRRELRISWGRGGSWGSFTVFMDHQETEHRLIAPGIATRHVPIEISFEYLKETPPFSEKSKRLELLERLNEIPDADISPERIDKRPSVPAHALRDEAALKQFLETFDWVISEIKAT